MKSILKKTKVGKLLIVYYDKIKDDYAEQIELALEKYGLNPGDTAVIAYPGYLSAPGGDEVCEQVE